MSSWLDSACRAGDSGSERRRHRRRLHGRTPSLPGAADSHAEPGGGSKRPADRGCLRPPHPHPPPVTAIRFQPTRSQRRVRKSRHLTPFDPSSVVSIFPSGLSMSLSSSHRERHLLAVPRMKRKPWECLAPQSPPRHSEFPPLPGSHDPRRTRDPRRASVPRTKI